MSTPDSKTTLTFRCRFVWFFIGVWICAGAVIPCFGQFVYQQIKGLPAGKIPGSDATDPSMGINPMGQLIEGIDGKLYGTMSQSGFPGNGGAIFRVNKDGSAYVALWKVGLGPNDC